MNGITSSLTHSQSLLIAFILWQMAVVSAASYFFNLDCISETVACRSLACFDWLPYRENHTARKQQFPFGSTFTEVNYLAASCFRQWRFF